MATTRDYYADLELSPNADIPEIKKQFRKLALRYHPDRNPGKEQEVNSKFQIIQSAHEILTDPEQKSKYDATRSKSKYPAASGVRGNPWANMGAQYPPPPRRNPNPPPRNPPSGAQRWQTRFSSGVPPTAKQYNSSDPEAKKNAARAFENMRKGQSGSSAKSTARPPPPPPPPRTESARQRAQAAFGARKTGYHPHSAMPGDEPPVTSSNYTPRPDPEPFVQETPDPKPQPREERRPRPVPMPDPLSQFRDKDNSMDPRQRSPYSTHGGEKTNPFDGIPLGRAKSTRETTSRAEGASSDDGDSPTQRFRSSSMPKTSKEESTAPTKSPEVDEQSQGSTHPGRKFAKPTLRSRRTNQSPTANGQIPQTEQSANDTGPKPQAENDSSGGPSMYAKQPQPQSNKSAVPPQTAYTTPPNKKLQTTQAANRHQDAASSYSYGDASPEESPSGRQSSPLKLTPFERQQRKLLHQLINNIETASPLSGLLRSSKGLGKPTASNSANQDTFHSFSFGVNDDTFTKTTPYDTNRFASSSADDINTRFVNDRSDTWKFSAGGSEQDPFPKTRSQSGGRVGGGSPNKRPAMRRTGTSDTPPGPDKTEGGFDPQGWADKFGPQIFTPQPAQTAGGSPTRPGRAPSRKSKPVKATAGTAALVDEVSSDDDVFEWRGRKGQATPVATDSPQAMDIDSPPRAPAEASPELNGVRNIHVEPSRPEWRPGHVEGANEDSKPTELSKKDFNPNAAGSEDSEEFRATLADLKNVAPFAQESSGLKSLNDLKDSLPFESKASEDIPIDIPKAQPLVFPTPPSAPRLPPTVAISGMKPNNASWENYLKEFETYLELWDAFNGQVVDHFATRKAHIAQTRASKGFLFLDTRGDGGVQEYFNWVQQDNDVRRRWCGACEEHEQRFREFMAFKQKMK